MLPRVCISHSSSLRILRDILVLRKEAGRDVRVKVKQGESIQNDKRFSIEREEGER